MKLSLLATIATAAAAVTAEYTNTTLHYLVNHLGEYNATDALLHSQATVSVKNDTMSVVHEETRTLINLNANPPLDGDIQNALYKLLGPGGIGDMWQVIKLSTNLYYASEDANNPRVTKWDGEGTGSITVQLWPFYMFMVEDAKRERQQQQQQQQQPKPSR